MLLFDFTDPRIVALFRPIGDRVMGGVSSGDLSPELSFAVFSGEVSFDNQGGFASVRSQSGSWDLSSFDGIELAVKGDGKAYKLSLTTDPRYDSIVYRISFTPAPGEWSLERLPFDEFVPTFRGERVPEAPALDPSCINTFGFLISDRQEGKFQLSIKYIKAY